MKKLVKLGYMALGAVLALVITVATPIVAATGTKQVNITFRNIKMFIDGVETPMVDGKGNVIEPFIFADGTYVPISAVAKALGKEVHWDNATSTAYIGKMVDKTASIPVPLSQLDYLTTSGSATSHGDEWVGTSSSYKGYKRWVQSPQMTDNKGGVRFTCLKFGCNDTVRREYFLDKAYKKLTGTIFLSSETPATRRTAGVTIKYKNEVLYKSDAITTGVAPIEFSVDLTGKDFVTIEVWGNTNGFDANGNTGSSDPMEIGLSEMTFWK